MSGVTYIQMSEKTGSIPVNTKIKTTTGADGEVQHVNVDTSALPSGAATSAKQDDLLTELQRKADLTETQPVSAASLPLPSGAATSALQTTLNTYYADTVETRVQTPTKTKAINVQIGPGDVISKIPVIMPYDHHQLHEGEIFRW